MSCLGNGELLVLAITVVIILSASRMGRLGNALGKFVYSFRQAARGGNLVDSTAKRVERGSEDAKVVDSKRDGS